MPTFGFAAFLKIASLNSKPQKTELRKRLFPTPGQAYDFHRSLKLASKKLLVDGIPIDGLLEAAKDVAKLPERKSLISGLTKLGLWREGATGDTYKVPSKVYESPRRLFKIAAQPEFGLVNGPSRIAFQIWNTKRPDLKAEAAYSTLALLPELYAADEWQPSDFGVLSLHEPKAHLLSERAVSPLSVDRLIRSVEDVILQILDEHRGPPPAGIGDYRPPT